MFEPSAFRSTVAGKRWVYWIAEVHENMERLRESTQGLRGRREVVKAGGGLLAMLAGLGVVRIATAQDATPAADGSRDLNGYYGITRSYVVAEGADVPELIGKVEGFVDIISAIPGFTAYVILLNESTRVWTAMSLFEDAESAQASTDAAADYVVENELGGYFENPSPTVVDGTVIINAGF
jgi:hypothetical protein